MDGSNYVNVKDQSKLEYGLMMLLAGIYNLLGAFNGMDESKPLYIIMMQLIWIFS